MPETTRCANPGPRNAAFALPQELRIGEHTWFAAWDSHTGAEPSRNAQAGYARAFRPPRRAAASASMPDSRLARTQHCAPNPTTNPKAACGEADCLFPRTG